MNILEGKGNIEIANLITEETNETNYFRKLMISSLIYDILNSIEILNKNNLSNDFVQRDEINLTLLLEYSQYSEVKKINDIFTKYSNRNYYWNFLNHNEEVFNEKFRDYFNTLQRLIEEAK